ncbi:MAG: hypothetical protein HC896_00125 [Bacteroidales bacterium]|nr:hypothetical protein [Bacteroidales bacterium]
MNVRSQFYLDFQARLGALAEIKHIDLYNNQLEHLKEEETFNFPAVFLEFGKIPWTAPANEAKKARLILWCIL